MLYYAKGDGMNDAGAIAVLSTKGEYQPELWKLAFEKYEEFPNNRGICGEMAGTGGMCMLNTQAFGELSLTPGGNATFADAKAIAQAIITAVP